MLHPASSNNHPHSRAPSGRHAVLLCRMEASCSSHARSSHSHTLSILRRTHAPFSGCWHFVASNSCRPTATTAASSRIACVSAVQPTKTFRLRLEPASLSLSASETTIVIVDPSLEPIPSLGAAHCDTRVHRTTPGHLLTSPEFHLRLTDNTWSPRLAGTSNITRRQ